MTTARRDAARASSPAGGNMEGDVELRDLLQDALDLWNMDLTAICDGSGVMIGQFVIRRGSPQRWNLLSADGQASTFPSILMLLAALRRALR